MLGTHPGLFSSLLQWHLHTAAPVRCPSQNARCSTSSLECAWSLVGCCVRPASWAALAKMQANKTESSCPCLDGDTIQRGSSLGCLLLFCLRHWTKTVSFPLWSNKNTYRVKCGRKIIAQREWGLWLRFNWLLIPGEVSPNSVSPILPHSTLPDFLVSQSQRAPGNF